LNLYLLYYPFLFFEEMHLIEQHVYSFVCSAKVISQHLSRPQGFLVIEDIPHALQKYFVFDLLAEKSPYCLSYLLQLETAL
jgi:hypothetical protein